MPILHMNTDAVQEVSQLLATSTQHIQERSQQLSTITQQLRSEWEGPSALMFESEMIALIEEVRRSAESGVTLRYRLEKEVLEWLEVAHTLGSGLLISPDKINPENEPVSSNSPSFYEQVGMATTSSILSSANRLKRGASKAIDKTSQAIDKTLEGISDISEKTLQQSDKLIQQQFDSLLPYQGEGSSEKASLTLEAGLVVDGIKFEAGSEIEIIRNPDGTYNVIMKNNAGLGLQAETPNASVKIGKYQTGLGVQASAEAMQSLVSGISYKFDPDNTGDMTEMGALFAALGASTTLPPLVSSTILPLAPSGSLFNNIDSVQFGTSTEASAKLNVNALMELAGLEIEGELGKEGILTKNDLGQWEQSSKKYIEGRGNVNLLDMGAGADAKMSIEEKINLSTNASSTIVTVELGGEYDLKSLNIPDLSMPSYRFTDSEKITIEYTLFEPYETIKDTFITSDGIPNLSGLAENSQIEVRRADISEFELGANGTVSVAGLEGEVILKRESESVIYSRSK